MDREQRYAPSDESDLELDDDETVPGQETLFGADDAFRVEYQEWQGMPEYVNLDLKPDATLLVKFRSRADLTRFLELIEVPATHARPAGKIAERSIWWPHEGGFEAKDKRYRSIDLDELLA